MRGRLVYIFLFTLALGGCHSKQSEKYENVFYWNISSGFTSMDPAFARTQANIWVCNQMFNGLVQLDDSLHVVPSIAKSWQISENGLIYTFHLRRDVFFQDDAAFENGQGRKVTAHDLVYSFNRILDPVTASPGAWIFAGKVTENGFIAGDDSTFVIKLIKPFRPFLQLLTLQYASVVPKEAVEAYGKDFRTHPVGTGPFKLWYYEEGEKLVLHRNELYFESTDQGRLPFLEAVVISFISSKQNEFFAFIKDDLSFLSGLDRSFKDNLLTRDGKLKEKFKGKFQFEVVPFLNTEYLGILVEDTTSMNPLSKRLIRQAISLSIDRQKMLRYLRNSIGVPGNKGFVPPSLMGDSIYYTYSLEKARELLKAAGYPEGRGLPAIDLYTTDDYLDMAVYVQKQLESIGMELSIQNVPASTLSELKGQSKAGFFRGSWIADYADPENYLSLFYSKNWSPGGPNYFHYKNEAFDKLYEHALQEPVDRKRHQLYRQMQRIVMEDAPVVVLYYDEVVRLKQKSVKGLTPNPINLISLKKVRMN